MARRASRGGRAASGRAGLGFTVHCALGFLCVAGLAGQSPARAQVHELDDLPWRALAREEGRRGAEMSWRLGRDGHTGWRSDRLGLTVLAPLGERGVFFLRGHYLRFDTGGLSAYERWPALLEADADGPAPDPGWPGEAVVNGFGRPDLGVIVPLRLPLLGDGDLGLLAGVPIGTDRLYPLSSACLPLALDWRLVRGGEGPWSFALRAGVEHTFSSSGDDLPGDAFPGGWRHGGELALHTAGVRGLSLAWSARELAGGRRVRHLVLDGWLPLGEGHRVGLQVARDLSGRDGRLAAWTVGLTWHLAGLPHDAAPIDRR